MARPRKPRILCVDDEPAVLEGITHVLRKLYDVTTATSGEDGLARLASEPGVAVILSDMRMPGMNGAQFLARARELAPDSTRMLLTGHADMDSAVAAINDGQIFRFLTKPCDPARLRAAMMDAVAQYRLVTSERVLLQQTLRSSVEVMLEALALVSPTYFGRAGVMRTLARDLAVEMSHPAPWQVEVAAMLSQLGYVVLPPDLAEKAYYGRRLTPEERAAVQRAYAQAADLVGPIPRLEGIRAVLRVFRTKTAAEVDATPRLDDDEKLAAKILRAAADYVELLADPSMDPGLAADTLAGREHVYEPRIVEALGRLRGGATRRRVAEVDVAQLAPGMVLAEDLKLATGVLVVARGYEVSRRLLERLAGFPRDALERAQVRVILPAQPEDEAA